MRTKSVMKLVLAASLTAALLAPTASARDGKCQFTNNGVIVSTGDVNSQNNCNDSSTNMQFCDQGTGAGAGAAGVGVGGGKGSSGGSEAGASTSCNQSD